LLSRTTSTSETIQRTAHHCHAIERFPRKAGTLSPANCLQCRAA